jgi:hypothetical protein
MRIYFLAKLEAIFSMSNLFLETEDERVRKPGKHCRGFYRMLVLSVHQFLKKRKKGK